METQKEVVKLTEAEVAQLKNLEERNTLLRNELANIGIARLNLEQAEDNAEKLYKENIELEQQIAKSLEDTYGQGRVNIATGEFIPS